MVIIVEVEDVKNYDVLRILEVLMNYQKIVMSVLILFTVTNCSETNGIFGKTGSCESLLQIFLRLHWNIFLMKSEILFYLK